MGDCDHRNKSWRSESSVHESRDDPDHPGRRQCKYRKDYYCECGTWMKAEVDMHWSSC